MALRTLLLLVIVMAAAACGPRGPDPLGEPQTRPDCGGCPELKLKLRDFAFVVGERTYKDGGELPPLPPGWLLIVADSEARQVHTLRVSGPNGEQRTPVIGVGQTGYLLAELTPGRYEIDSVQGESRQQGMWATVRVEQPGLTSGPSP